MGTFGSALEFPGGAPVKVSVPPREKGDGFQAFSVFSAAGFSSTKGFIAVALRPLPVNFEVF